MGKNQWQNRQHLGAKESSIIGNILREEPIVPLSSFPGQQYMRYEMTQEQGYVTYLDQAKEGREDLGGGREPVHVTAVILGRKGWEYDVEHP